MSQKVTELRLRFANDDDRQVVLDLLQQQDDDGEFDFSFACMLIDRTDQVDER
jgi:hypothetical protein